nr:hypothetical protein [Streptomyces aureus]
MAESPRTNAPAVHETGDASWDSGGADGRHGSMLRVRFRLMIAQDVLVGAHRDDPAQSGVTEDIPPFPERLRDQF